MARLFLLPACAPLMASGFGNPFSALIRRGAVGRRLSCGWGWQSPPRALPHLMYNYTDGETQVCLLSAIETLFTEMCAHLHCSICLSARLYRLLWVRCLNSLPVEFPFSSDSILL